MNKAFLITKIDNVIFVGKNEYPNSRTIFKKNLTYHELILHLSGYNHIKFNGKTFDCKEGTIRFLPKGPNKEYVVDKIMPTECIDIFFDTDMPISEEAFVINLKNNTKIDNLFKKIFSIWVSKNDGYYFECISVLYKIFAELQKNEYISKNQYEKIKPALEYIENNFLNEKISVKHLAYISKISESYLKRLFVKNFGVSPIKYIIHLKINYACDLLRSDLYNIRQICEMCGYDNPYFFSRQFKEYMGISPTEFKNQYNPSKYKDI